MADKQVQADVVQAFGRDFVKGNIPEINPVRCLGCGHCVPLCKKLGPDVLAIKDGIARVVRPGNCISDGACMLACPTKALFLMSRHDPASPPAAI